MFFIKSNNITENTTTLHRAVSITTSIASIYEDSDGSLEAITDIMTNAKTDNNVIYVYYDKEYQQCKEENFVYYVVITQMDSSLNKINIEFHDSKDNIIHSITACSYVPATLGSSKEVALP